MIGPRFKLAALASALLVFSVPFPLHAEDLIEVLRLGQENDARWASARASREAGVEKEKQGSAGLLPVINLTANHTSSNSEILYHGTTPFSSGDRNYDTTDFGVNITHPLYRRQNYAAYQQSVTQVALSDEQLNLARTDLMLRVASAYLEQLYAQDSVGLSIAEIDALSEQLGQAKAQFDAGVMAVTDLFDTRARHDLARARQVAANNDLLSKQQALRRILDRVVQNLAGIRPGVVLPTPQPDVVETWVTRAHAHNTQVKTQIGTRRVAEWEVERARGAHYPTLDLVAGYSKNRTSGSLYTQNASNSDTLSAGVRFQMPLYSGGDTTSRVREAVANLDKASRDLEDTRRDVENQCRLTYLSLANGISQIQALEQALESNEKLLESSRLGRAAGLRTTTDVLNAQQQLFSIKRDLSKARYDYILNYFKLKGIAGVLGEEDFVRVNALLFH